MHPTIDEQLHGAQRLLDLVGADDALSPASRESLVNVQRLLKQIGRSWSTLLPFLTEDNQVLAALLRGVGPLAGPALAAEVDAAVAAPPVGTALDVAAVSARNDELRGLLTRVVAALPPGSGGTPARAEIGAYLRHRVDIDPS